PNAAPGASRVASQRSAPPAPPARSDSKYSDSPSTLSSGLPSRDDELMAESGCGETNVAERAARVASQMSAPPSPPARSDSNTMVSSSDVSDGAAAFEVGRLSSAIATGAPNADAALFRADMKISVRAPPVARVELK